jgi:hypothetical protein
LRAIGLDRLLGPAGNRCRDLVIAMITTRVMAPASKLATARALVWRDNQGGSGASIKMR